MRTFLRHFFDEWLFYLSLFLALSTSLFLKRLPRITAEEVQVLFILWVFLILIKGLQTSGLLDRIALKISRGSFLGLKLVLFTGLLSTFITNDVALIVMVPLTLAVGSGGVEKVLIFETLAANGLSAVSPIGNPQNIFIYLKYSLRPGEFFKVIWPFGALVLLLLTLLSPKELKERGAFRELCVKSALPVALLFLIFVFVALKLLPLYLGVLPLLYVLFFRRELFNVDYFLLGTFLFFFAFTDNLSYALKIRIDSDISVFSYSALLSQVMSNVPAALLVSEFTDRWAPLLWGVSVGGFGTLVSSMANLITYRLYKEWGGDGKGFLLRFHFYNFLFFFVGSLIYILMLRAL
ncbi:MAG: SLC13 family permease [Desulfurobacteriaceae bacterium]